MEQLNIVFLADHPEFINTCASWAYGQWGCQAGGSLERAISKFTLGAGKENIPMTLMALYDEKPAGMISLWEADYEGKPELSPWLASLYVHPFFRHKNIATSLIRRLETEALRLGYGQLFLVTEDSKKLYQKCGWTELEEVVTHYGEASLMTKLLE